MLGVIIAALAQLQMFALLGVSTVPARFDVLITGLIIGSGSYPVHSLVGILQQGKDTLVASRGTSIQPPLRPRRPSNGSPRCKLPPLLASLARVRRLASSPPKLRP